MCHDCYDALLATGFSKYIIGSMAAPVRWILRMGGLPSDKQGGIADLQTTAEHGHYLAPFARILLAIAYVREKDKPRALQLLTGLQRRSFPEILYFLARLRICSRRIRASDFSAITSLLLVRSVLPLTVHSSEIHPFVTVL